MQRGANFEVKILRKSWDSWSWY